MISNYFKIAWRNLSKSIGYSFINVGGLTVGMAVAISTGRFMQAGAPEMLSLKMIKGTWEGLKDPSSIMLTASTAKALFGKEDPVNEIIRWSGQGLRIIGVVRDMVMESPFEPVRQTIYIVNYSAAKSWINIRINPNISTREALAKIEALFKDVLPAVPFDYKFVDTEYGLKFAAEERIGKLATVFAVLAIFISCLGLFGLASFIAEKRTKEIGIRKVLGATIYNIWKMLSVDFVLLVIISCCIAVPIAYYLLSQWLQKYEYRTEINWWIFALAIVSALIFTLLTVSFQAIKAALVNPVKNLRTE